MSSRTASPFETLEAENSYPPILLASDNSRVAESLHRVLTQAGFVVQLAPSYRAAGMIWEQHRHPMVLLEVSNVRSVEAAVDAAMNIKRLDAGQFVGYLADPILRTSGLAGDAIFPRSIEQLTEAIRNHFESEALR
jgi:hypothetical protein